MKVVLLRHSLTSANLARRYIGRRSDEPLCAEGRALAKIRRVEIGRELAALGIEQPDTIHVSPLARVRETAELVFPGVPQVEESSLCEMDFGDFEGHTADEMAAWTAYRSWVDGGCEGACPHGESRDEFVHRVSVAFKELARAVNPCTTLAVIAHGGTLMALMSAFGRPMRSYFSWRTPICGGYAGDLECEPEPVLTLLGEL